jgi:enolase-phosphatase E1
VAFSIAIADAQRLRIVLLDIEGTTTPIDFVYKTLFPYAHRKVEDYLRDMAGDPELAGILLDLRGHRDADNAMGQRPPAWRVDNGGEATILSAVEYVRWLITKDSKCTPLKALQGKIWQQGFDSGELHGEVYEDVPRAFARWRAQGRDICIYSSGSVQAQQMLFATIASGELKSQIRGFFDTQIGPKISADSYRRIAASLRCEPAEIVFVSDAQKEVDASMSAGMKAVLCDRSNVAAPNSAVIRTFDELFAD